VGQYSGFGEPGNKIFKDPRTDDLHIEQVWGNEPQLANTGIGPWAAPATLVDFSFSGVDHGSLLGSP